MTPKLLKTFWAGKLCAIFLLLVSGLPWYGNATPLPLLQQHPLSVHFKNIALTSVFEEIKKQTDYVFSYSKEIAEDTHPISIDYDGNSINDLMNLIAEKAGLEFKIVNKNISIKLLKPIKDKTINNSIQQEMQVAGLVTGEDGIPLTGAVILEKGTSNGMIADSDGKYSIVVLNGTAVLQFSYMGYITQEIPVNNRHQINMELQPESTALDEIVVIGYGSQKKSSVTGSVAKITSSEIEHQAVTSFDDAIAGQLAGVSISQNSGAPGTTAEINIRGIGTLTAGRNPLLVIDGFPSSESTDLTSINPNNIASIEILKDASAAAIYGSRGSNGVILITTKGGAKNKMEFFFNSFYGFQQVTKKIGVTDAYERARLIADARNNSWIEINPGNTVEDPNFVRPSDLQIPDYLFPYLEGQKGLTNTDWQDEIFRTAPIASYELATSGGSEDVTFFVSGNYHQRDGIVINSDYTRYSVTGNLKANLSPRLTLGLNLTPTFTNSHEINEGDHKDNGIIFTALIANPMYAPYNADGSLHISQMVQEGSQYGFAPVENPVALAKLTSSQKKVNQMLGSFYMDWHPVETLVLKTQLGGQTISARDDVFVPSILGGYAVAAPTKAFGRSETDDIINYSWENTATYKTILHNSHIIEVLLGHSFQSEKVEGNNLLASNFPNDRVTTLNAGQIISGSSYREQWNLLSFFGRVHYNYKSKYLLSAALRRDASSRFGKNNKWGAFPSVSAGWDIAKESLFRLKNVSNLKLRASYGITGNNQISNYGSIALLGESNYVLNGRLVNGQSVVTAPNDNLSWEKTSMFNAGIDVQLNGGQYTFTAEYFVADTKDLLLDVPVPAHTGYDTSLQNLGKVRNSGFELSAGSTINIGALEWKPSINVYTLQNKVLALGPGQERILNTVHVTEIGQPIGSYYGYNVLGVYKNEEDLQNSPSLATSQIGSYKYEDINGDGEITDADRKILGDFFPDYTFGFTSHFQYKSLDLNIVTEGKQGYQVFYGLGFFHFNLEGWSNTSSEIAGNYFSTTNPNAVYAQPLASPTDKNYEYSSLMVQDGSYVRIKNISLGYSIPKKLVKSIGMKYVRVYATAQNPFTFTKYIGYNPDVSSKNKSWNKETLTRGVDYGAYPLARSLVFGVQAKF